MSGKMTRAEKCSKHFQEVMKAFIAKGMNPQAAMREARRLPAKQTLPPKREVS